MSTDVSACRHCGRTLDATHSVCSYCKRPVEDPATGEAVLSAAARTRLGKLASDMAWRDSPRGVIVHTLTQQGASQKEASELADRVMRHRANSHRATGSLKLIGGVVVIGVAVLALCFQRVRLGISLMVGGAILAFIGVAGMVGGIDTS